MLSIERQIAREAKAMTREEVFMKAIEGRITWLQAAEILGITDRHMRRLRKHVEMGGLRMLVDRRCTTRRQRRVPVETIEMLCKLRRELYADFSIRHFYEFATEKHGLELSYTLTRSVLQGAGLAERAPARGKYRRRRDRRPMRGMMLHLDASTHRWIAELPMHDLVVVLDDADSQILYARFVEQEGTRSTLQALHCVLVQHGRFCELYTDRGSHFCNTSKAEYGPDDPQRGQVPRVLRALGIRQILARSPEARGRSERAFGTIQGRLPQELRLARITDYDAANEYLSREFVPMFNRRFTVTPSQPESAFTPLAGVDLRLLLSIQSERVVRNDGTIQYGGLRLQLPSTPQRTSYARCPVTIHDLLDEKLVVTFQGRVLAEFTSSGALIGARRKAA